jgi:hypothetical protein
MRIRQICGIAAVSLVFSATMSHAQDTASLTGSVHDATGASIANAAVAVTSMERGIARTTTTNSDGEYSVPALPAPAAYNITVDAKGFKKYQATGVVLRVAQKARVDVSLEVGAATTEVTVLGSTVAQVETQSSDLAGTVTGKEITQLELNGRNFTQLVTLVPGVTNQTGQDEGQVGIAGSVSYSINGGRVEYNNWELDGGDNMDNGSNASLNVYPSLEAIAEFKVLTSNYGAQYGRSGSGTVEVETKSGTSSFHGNAYEFVRNDTFNARNYFLPSVPPYKKNDFGYTIGGPVFIPGVYNTGKQKTFFFWSQEWRRDRVPATYNSPVPTLAERAGDFSAACLAGVGCPNVGNNGDITGLQAFQDSQPVAQALLATIPLPNNASGDAFVGTAPEPVDWREELIRIDHNINDKNRLTFRYIHDSWVKQNAVPLWTNVGSFPTIGTNFKGPGVSLVTRLSTTFSPTLLNEFVFSYTTDHIVLTNTGAWKRPDGLPIGDLFGGNGGGIVPGYNLVTNLYNGGFGMDAGYIPNGPFNANPTYTYRDNVSKSIGKHNLQFGAYIVTAQKNELGGELGAGSIPGYLTFDESSAVSSGNAFADMLLGYISSFGQQDKRIKYYNRYKIVEPYFQDDWRITSRLTLNLGLRLSLFGTYRERYHQAYNFDPSKYQAGVTTLNDDGTVNNLFINGLPNGIVQCGVTAGVPDSCMKGHLFNPAPRIGFAWDPQGNGKTAIRGGYGIFFEHANGNEGNSESLENSPPLATTVQQNNIGGGGVSGYALIGGGGELAPQFPLSVNAIPTKATWPYMQQWHFDVQHEFLKNTVATVSYVGSRGTHLSRQSNLNQLHPVASADNPYKPGEAMGPDDCANGTTPSGVLIPEAAATNFAVACGGNPDPFRQYIGYGDITHLQFAASSTYHALQTSVRHTIGGLELNFSYTYSHAIDDSSDRYDSAFNDSFNPSANRASSAFDQRHVLNLSYVWDLPFFKQPGLTHKVLGGWQLSGITNFQTGTPYGVSFAADNAGVANGVGAASRPDLIGNPKAIPQSALDGYSPLFANPNAFAAPRGLTFGNSGRNLLRNPNRTNFDMALFKHFAIKEQTAFEFRAEAYNIFNHTQWLPVAGDSGSGAANNASGDNTFSTDPGSGFLRTQGTHNARILQLGLKFMF